MLKILRTTGLKCDSGPFRQAEQQEFGLNHHRTARSSPANHNLNKTLWRLAFDYAKNYYD